MAWSIVAKSILHMMRLPVQSIYATTTNPHQIRRTAFQKNHHDQQMLMAIEMVIHQLSKRNIGCSILCLTFILLQGGDGNVVNFYSMVGTMTRMKPLEFNNYGRYCGLWGEGEPLDELDTCCLLHDQCYVQISGEECAGYGGPFAPFWIFYTWDKLENGTIICGESPFNIFGSCAAKTCECDVKITRCFAENVELFDGRKRKTLMWRIFEVILHKILYKSFVAIQTTVMQALGNDFLKYIT